jgi:rare lipoprotein A
MMTVPRKHAILSMALAAVLLAGCHAADRGNPQPAAPTPGHGIGLYKVGQSYEVNGIWYYPTTDLDYEETGIASWYGPGFNMQYTANGEVFDQNEVSAAHKTLPLPSIAQVTNLDNGRSIQVRINDRGPFVGTRIIDMSRRAAQLLGFEQQGTAKVKVRVLVPETIQAQSLARMNGSSGVPESAEIAPAPPAVPRGAVIAQALPPPTGGRPAPPPPPPPPPPAATAPPPLPEPVKTPANAVPPGPPLSNTVMVAPVQPTHIFVQAGAYASDGNAQRMKAKLAAIGPVAITAVRINGMNVYRVRLGPLGSVDQADATLAKAVGAGAVEAKIVVD